jgi:hypothetical protein
MPVLFDVNDAFGLDLEDEFEVIRRPLTVNSNGRSTVNPFSLGIQKGVIGPTPTSLERTPDYGISKGNMWVFTPFRLYFLREGFQPDYIIYGGDRYVVVDLTDYTMYGRGFVQAMVHLTQSSPSEPAPYTGLSP